MSIELANLLAKAPKKKRSRDEILALHVPRVYDDGRTQQCFKDECDINKIMARAARGGTISHLAKYEPVYADFSDYDFAEQTRRLTLGREIFDALPAELRREFNQSPAEFFDFVNDPANAEDLAKKLPGLAKPGDQLPQVSPPNADQQAAQAAASEPASANPQSAEEPPAEKPQASTEAS